MTRLISRWLSCTAAVVFVLASAGFALSAPPNANDKVFVGYLYQKPPIINYSLYTHLCHAFVTADGEGKINQGRGVPSRDLTTEAHEAVVKVILSLGGWGWDEQFAAIVSKPDAEERYATDVLKMVDEYDYDGIDFDWEYPDAQAEVAGFERLTRRFRKELDEIGQKKSRRMFLTMAVSANPATIKWITNELVLENYDWLNIMTYDYSSGRSGIAAHHSPLFASSKAPGTNRRSAAATMEYLLQEKGLPANRLALGIPLYGRGFLATEAYGQVTRPPEGTIQKKGRGNSPVPPGNYSNLHRLREEGGWKRTWDDETKNPWLISPDGKVVVGYDDAESVAIKTEWAMQKGLRGVCFWQIAADRLPDGTYVLQEASHKAWQAEQRP